MRIRFHTNLDEAKADVGRIGASGVGVVEDDWFGGRVPCIGERVILPLTPDNQRDTYDLEVVGVAYDTTTSYVRVELHIPPGRGWSIRTWSEWLTKRKRGG